MATLTPRPIIKSLGEDTSNKDAPSQTTIGTGVPYAGNITSSEPNGFFYIIYEAVKNLQRLGGQYGATIPYSKGQSCKVLIQQGDYYAIKRFVCVSTSESTGNAPYTGATVTTLNGVDVYSGGVINTTYWAPADFIDGYDYNIATYVDATPSVAALAAVNYKQTGRQYVNVTISAISGVDPETNRTYFAKAPSLDELLTLMDYLYFPKWAAQYVNIVANPIRRLGSYIFRGQRVEAFGMFLSGVAFTDNGTSAQSLFWRSMSSAYSAQCVVDNTSLRDYLFTGTAGGTITPRNWMGRVAACDGTPHAGADARAGLGGTQNDQIQLHWHTWGVGSHIGSLGLDGTNWFNSTPQGGYYTGAPSKTIDNTVSIREAITDGTHGALRGGNNTRESTYTVPVPMVVTLVPYGLLTL